MEDLKKLSYPKIICKIECEETNKAKMQILESFVRNYGNEIPIDATLLLPNGRRFKARFNAEDSIIEEPGKLRSEFLVEFRMILVLSYLGKGVFLTNILDGTYSEIKYDVELSVQSSSLRDRDEESAIGFSFTCGVYGGILLNGAAEIPSSFRRRFTMYLPRTVTLYMSNGEVISGIYTKRDQKIYGFMSLIKKKHILPYDKLFFLYSGGGCFKIHIFSSLRLEKLISPHTVDFGIAEHIGYMPSESHAQNKCTGTVECGLNPDLEFTCSMTTSNIDGSSHGPYIPHVVLPDGKNLVAGESVLHLRQISVGGPRSKYPSHISEERRNRHCDIKYLSISLLNYPEN